ncbi:MAG TPA: hypothetical protein VMD53_02110 [Rhizomicrobium sp.]|nr:hypothetical protein [Rhizomicrobium sp.]
MMMVPASLLPWSARVSMATKPPKLCAAMMGGSVGANMPASSQTASCSLTNISIE